MSFFGWQLTDILIRAIASGQLLAIIIALRHHSLVRAISEALLLFCIIAYLALTAPIADQHYGGLRAPLLLITDITCYALLNYYWLRVKGKALWQALPLTLKVLCALWFVALTILFLGFAGQHVLHDINHAIGFVLLVMILWDAVRDYGDDLVERRRQARRTMIAGISGYMLLLTILELTDSHLRDNPYFSMGNALLAFSLITFFVFYQSRSTDETIQNNDVPQTIKNSDYWSVQDSSTDVQPLLALMESGLYNQHQLTIGLLANKLALPEHQLRRLINQKLGFENFSQFVNSYRIPIVCEKLKDPARAKDPILTIALETGFNSIASFNRAFKKEKGVTPSQFRAQF